MDSKTTNRSKKSGAADDGERSSTEVARLLTVTAGVALVALLLAGCGGGGDRAKVEASRSEQASRRSGKTAARRSAPRLGHAS
jgi:hypothetical protein